MLIYTFSDCVDIIVALSLLNDLDRLNNLCLYSCNNFQIAFIDVEGLRQLPMVQTLDLQNNSIAQVPPQLGTITTLKSVCVPHHIPDSSNCLVKSHHWYMENCILLRPMVKIS